MSEQQPEVPDGWSSGPAGDYSRLNGGRVEFHSDHPDYFTSDDYYYEQADRAQEAAEAEYAKECDHEEALVIDQLANDGMPTDGRATVYEPPGENGLDRRDFWPEDHAQDLETSADIVAAMDAEQRLDRAVVAATTPPQIDMTVYDTQPETRHESGHAHSA